MSKTNDARGRERAILISIGLRKGKIRKRERRKWMRYWGLNTWGIQTGPFAEFRANFVLKIFQLLHFHTGEPILITPEG